MSLLLFWELFSFIHLQPQYFIKIASLELLLSFMCMSYPSSCVDLSAGSGPWFTYSNNVIMKDVIWVKMWCCQMLDNLQTTQIQSVCLLSIFGKVWGTTNWWLRDLPIDKTKGNNLSQCFGSLLMNFLSICLSVWLKYSTSPSVSGWYKTLCDGGIFNSLHTSFSREDIKLVPWSVEFSKGKPTLITALINSLTSCFVS